LRDLESFRALRGKSHDLYCNELGMLPSAFGQLSDWYNTQISAGHGEQAGNRVSGDPDPRMFECPGAVMRGCKAG
jgi:hypothetical protein